MFDTNHIYKYIGTWKNLEKLGFIRPCFGEYMFKPGTGKFQPLTVDLHTRIILGEDLKLLNMFDKKDIEVVKYE